jgi:hypothetical protein
VHPLCDGARFAHRREIGDSPHSGQRGFSARLKKSHGLGLASARPILAAIDEIGMKILRNGLCISMTRIHPNHSAFCVCVRNLS